MLGALAASAYAFAPATPIAPLSAARATCPAVMVGWSDYQPGQSSFRYGSDSQVDLDSRAAIGMGSFEDYYGEQRMMPGHYGYTDPATLTREYSNFGRPGYNNAMERLNFRMATGQQMPGGEYGMMGRGMMMGGRGGYHNGMMGQGYYNEPGYMMGQGGAYGRGLGSNSAAARMNSRSMSRAFEGNYGDQEMMGGRMSSRGQRYGFQQEGFAPFAGENMGGYHSGR